MQQQAQAPVRKPLFTEEELHILHAEDRSAGAAIVVLMAGVFTIGLVMYLIIAYITSS